MIEATPRHGLPLLQPGQAQKELAHNEALAALDLLSHPAVVAVGENVPPAAPQPGESWIVGTSPTGDWAGQANALAGWTTGGWRFAAPTAGMTVWTGGASGFVRWSGTAWAAGALSGATLTLAGQQVVGSRRPAIPDPAGGASVDAEARGALAAVLAALREHGLISG